MAQASVLKFSERLVFGLGHTFNDMCGVVWNTYLLLFLQYIMTLPSSVAGLILFSGQLADGITTPVVGFLSDKFRPCWKYGRRKTIHLIGSVLVALSFPFIFIKCYGCEFETFSAILLYFIPIVCLYQMGWATVQVSHLSLIPELSDVQWERDELTIIRYALDVATNILLYTVTWIMLSVPVVGESEIGRGEFQSLNESDDWRFRNIAVIVTVVGIVLVSIFHWGTPERPVDTTFREKEALTGFSYPMGDSTETLLMKWSDWFREGEYFKVGSLLVMARLYVSLNQVFIPLFLQEDVHAPQSSLALIPLVLEVSGFSAVLVIKCLLKFLNKKVTYILASCLAFTGSIVLGFDTVDGIRSGDIYIIAVIIGAGASMQLVLAVSLTSELIGTNTESGSFVIGSYGFIEKLLNGLIILTVQSSHEYCKSCQTFYKDVISYGLSLITLGSLAVLLSLDLPKVNYRSEINTLEGRAKLIEKKKAYGSVNKGFPLFCRADTLTQQDSSS